MIIRGNRNRTVIAACINRCVHNNRPACLYGKPGASRSCHCNIITECYISHRLQDNSTRLNIDVCGSNRCYTTRVTGKSVICISPSSSSHHKILRINQQCPDLARRRKRINGAPQINLPEARYIHKTAITTIVTATGKHLTAKGGVVVGTDQHRARRRVILTAHLNHAA